MAKWRNPFALKVGQALKCFFSSPKQKKRKRKLTPSMFSSILSSPSFFPRLHKFLSSDLLARW